MDKAALLSPVTGLSQTVFAKGFDPELLQLGHRLVCAECVDIYRKDENAHVSMAPDVEFHPAGLSQGTDPFRAYFSTVDRGVHAPDCKLAVLERDHEHDPRMSFFLEKRLPIVFNLNDPAFTENRRSFDRPNRALLKTGIGKDRLSLSIRTADDFVRRRASMHRYWDAHPDQDRRSRVVTLYKGFVRNMGAMFATSETESVQRLIDSVMRRHSTLERTGERLHRPYMPTAYTLPFYAVTDPLKEERRVTEVFTEAALERALAERSQSDLYRRMWRTPDIPLDHPGVIFHCFNKTARNPDKTQSFPFSAARFTIEVADPEVNQVIAAHVAQDMALRFLAPFDEDSLRSITYTEGHRKQDGLVLSIPLRIKANSQIVTLGYEGMPGQKRTRQKACGLG